MKNVIAFLTGLTLLTASSALADQFEVFVTSASHVSIQQAELNTLVQRGIYIDTARKIVRLTLPADCKANTFCKTSIITVDLALTAFNAAHEQPTDIKAVGNITLNGKTSYTQVHMTLNANNSMDIEILNSFDCKSNTSSFIGAPAQATTATF